MARHKILKPQSSDPIKAQEAIRKMKHCSSVEVIRATNETSEVNGPNKFILKELQSAIWWLVGYYSTNSFETSIKNLKSVHQSVSDCLLWYEENDTSLTVLVQIDMVTIYGIETWLVQDFDLGPEKSKWFRGKSSQCQWNFFLAMLKFANIRTTMEKNVHRKMSTSEVKRQSGWIISRLNGKTKWEEKKTGDEIEVSYTIKIGRPHQKSTECFTGKSKTNGAPKAVSSGEQIKIRKEAGERARKMAEKQFFNAYFGVDGVKEFTVDEFGPSL